MKYYSVNTTAATVRDFVLPRSLLLVLTNLLVGGYCLCYGAGSTRVVVSVLRLAVLCPPLFKLRSTIMTFREGTQTELILQPEYARIMANL